MFVIVFSTMLLLAHAYIWLRIVREPRWSPLVRWLLTAAIAGGWLGITGSLWAWRAAPFDKVSTFRVMAFIWLGAMFHLVVFLAAWDLLRLGSWPFLRARRRAVTTSEPAPAAVALPNLERRAFLARSAAATTAVATGGVAAWGVHSARRELLTPETIIALPRLPKALEGLRVVQICDMHIGPVLNETFTRRVVSRINDLKPDLVVIVGDLVDGPVSVLERDIRPLGDLRSRFGTFFVTGNHEYYSGVAGWLDYLPRIGVRVLANERVEIGDSAPGGATFDLAGIHDRAGRRGGTFAPDIAPIIRERNADRELLLLSHQPIEIDQAVKAGAGLQLSGHTHGGQLWPFGGLVLLAQPYLAGLYRHTPQTQIYVSRGTGFWGPPMRVFAPAEISQIVLTQA